MVGQVGIGPGDIASQGFGSPVGISNLVIVACGTRLWLGGRDGPGSSDFVRSFVCVNEVSSSFLLTSSHD